MTPLGIRNHICLRAKLGKSVDDKLEVGGGTVVCFLEISWNILLKEPHFVTQGGLLSWNIL